MSERKVAYNCCYGGFSLSKEAVELAHKLAPNDTQWLQVDPEYGFIDGIERHDPVLIEVIETLGNEKASGDLSNLKIDTVYGPYRIDEYDGFESIEEPYAVDWK
ncbi:MAG: hypothetical protein HRT61_00975 [Ekhidna sp.]|nr:hypothetical protein [Ekhidna sp.]